MIYLLLNLVQQYPILLYPTTIYLKVLLINCGCHLSLGVKVSQIVGLVSQLKFLWKGTGVP